MYAPWRAAILGLYRASSRHAHQLGTVVSRFDSGIRPITVTPQTADAGRRSLIGHLGPAHSAGDPRHRSGEHVRPDGSLHRRHVLPRFGRRNGGRAAHRKTAAELPRLHFERTIATGRDRRCGRVVPGRGGTGARLHWATGVNGGTFCGRSVCHCTGLAPVQDGRPGALARRRRNRVSGPRRHASQDPRLPGGTGRDRSGAAGPSGDCTSGGHCDDRSEHHASCGVSRGASRTNDPGTRHAARNARPAPARLHDPGRLLHAHDAAAHPQRQTRPQALPAPGSTPKRRGFAPPAGRSKRDRRNLRALARRSSRSDATTTFSSAAAIRCWRSR